MCWICELEQKMAQRLTEAEKALSKDVNRVLREQYQEAVRRKTWRTGNTDWLRSDKQDRKVQRAIAPETQNAIDKGIATGTKRAGITVTDIEDRTKYKHLKANVIDRNARTINETSADKLKAVVDRLESEGRLNSKTFKEEAKKVFGLADKEKNPRANRIALTQAQKAEQGGEMTVYQESGVFEKVMWKAKSTACPFCLKLDGKTRYVNDPFVKLGTVMTARGKKSIIKFVVDYDNVLYPPLHPNCRCHLIPVGKAIKNPLINAT